MRSDSNSHSSLGTNGWDHLRHTKISKHNSGNRPFAYAGNFFCSRSEAACAALMQKYLGYSCTEGVTFQVPMGKSPSGQTRHFDFLVFDAVVEYHPFHPPKDPQYWKLLHRLKPGQRQQLRDLWARNDEIRYADTRRAQLDECAHLMDKELLVARSPEDFYEKVIVRFMHEKHIAPFRRIPDLASFVREFQEILGEVTELKAPRTKRVRVRQAEERKRKQG